MFVWSRGEIQSKGLVCPSAAFPPRHVVHQAQNSLGSRRVGSNWASCHALHAGSQDQAASKACQSGCVARLHASKGRTRDRTCQPCRQLGQACFRAVPAPCGGTRPTPRRSASTETIISFLSVSCQSPLGPTPTEISCWEGKLSASIWLILVVKATTSDGAGTWNWRTACATHSYLAKTAAKSSVETDLSSR